MADREEERGKSATQARSARARHDRPMTIAEMSEEFGVTYRTLRFYQQKGLLAPERRGNIRLYTRRDYVHMKIITDARKVGMPLADVGEILAAYHHKDGEQIQNKVIIERLGCLVKKLSEQHATLTAQLEEARRMLSEREREAT